MYIYFSIKRHNNPFFLNILLAGFGMGKGFAGSGGVDFWVKLEGGNDGDTG